MSAVSDTSPICYLILIEAIDLLPQIYGQVIIPTAVHTELSSSKAPGKVRDWMKEKPEWMTVQKVLATSDAALSRLDIGECEAILLAESLLADVVLIDERAARDVATGRGLSVVGLLGVLGVAADMGLIEFKTAVERLQETSMWLSPNLIQKLLDQYS